MSQPLHNYIRSKKSASRHLCAIFFVTLLFLSTSSFSQEKSETIRFEIQVLGLKIGDLNVKKYEEGDTLHYLAQSRVKFWFFGNVDVDVSTHSKYVGGYFVKSRSTSKSNRGDFATDIHWDGRKYVVDAKSYKFENREPVEGLVEWCSARIFFEELQEGKRLISEVYGFATTIGKMDAGAYRTEISGNENQYFYQDGKLQRVILENSIKNFQYKRIK